MPIRSLPSPGRLRRADPGVRAGAVTATAVESLRAVGRVETSPDTGSADPAGRR